MSYPTFQKSASISLAANVLVSVLLTIVWLMMALTLPAYAQAPMTKAPLVASPPVASKPSEPVPQPTPIPPTNAPLQLAGSSKVNSTLPVPPAVVIATRLLNYGDYQGAVKKLNDVVSSRMYKGSAYVPEALYSIAHIDATYLHDDNGAIVALNTIENNHMAIDFPHKPVIAAEKAALSIKVDAENRSSSLAGVKWTSGNPLIDIWNGLLATGYYVIDQLVKLTGEQSWSYWFAIVLISVIFRLLLTPLTIKQYKSMKETQRLQPLLKELQAKYKSDQAVLSAKMQELYKEHNVNPAASCLPLLLQLPVFFYVYHAVWLYQYHFSKGTFLWINPTSHALAPQIFGANLGDQDIVLLGIYAISMWVSQRLAPAQPAGIDPAQAEAQKMTAVITSVMMFYFFQNLHFPSAFVLYYTITNIISTLTQLYFTRQNNGELPLQGILPQDGESSANATVQGRLVGSNVINGSSDLLPNNGYQGAAKGVIAPRSHPKKKRR